MQPAPTSPIVTNIMLKLGIRARILFLILAATVLPLLLMDLYWVNSQQQSLLNNARATQVSVTENVGNQVDNFISRKVRALIIHSQSPSLQFFDINKSTLEIDALLFQDKDITKAALVDRNGQEVVSIKNDLKPDVPKNVKNTDAFRAASYLSGKEYISPVLIDASGRPSITIAVPMVTFTQPQDLSNLSTAESGVVRGSQDIKGMLIVQVSLDSLWSNVLLPASRDHGYAYAVDSQGTVIAHPDNSLVKMHKDFSAVPIVNLFKSNIDKTAPDNRTIAANSEKNVLVLATFQKVAATNWGVIFEEPMSSIYQSVNNSLGVSVALAISAIVVMGLLSLSLSRYITNPILLIARTTKQIGQGDLSARITRIAKDEIGELSLDINNMAGNLQEYIGRSETQRHRIEAILNNTVESILAIDGDGKITIANNSTVKLTGLRIDKIIGKQIEDIFKWQKQNNPFSIDFFAPGTQVYDELAYTNPTGALHDVKVIVVRPTEFQSAAQAIITIHDETESRELEKMKIDFVSLAAHELRTPLAAVRGYLDLISYQGGANLDEKIKHYVDQSRTSVVELGDLIGNLLNVTRIERGTLALTMSKIDLADCAVQSVQSLQFNAAGRNIKLSYNGPTTGSFMIGDEVAMREVLRNLVDNAIKYTLPNGVVEVTLSDRPQHYVLTVKDTGIGIPAKALPHLFTKFYRVHGGLESGSRGTGLGLFIAKSIVERHNGTIGVVSKEGEGSVFTITLPKFESVSLTQAQAAAEQSNIRRKRGWITKNIAR